MNVSTALKKILKHRISISAEKIFLKDSIGRTLSNPIKISKNIPEFDTSSMDGFAVKKSAIGKIKKFAILGEIPAGAGRRPPAARAESACRSPRCKRAPCPCPRGHCPGPFSSRGSSKW